MRLMKKLALLASLLPGLALASAPKAQLFEMGGARAMAAAFRAKLPAKSEAVSLVIHGDHAQWVAIDPRKPTRLNSYDYRKGLVSPPAPQRKNDDTSGRFMLEEVNLGAIPQVAHDALIKAGVAVEDAKVTHMVIDRRGPKTPIAWRVFLKTNTGSATVDFDGQGKFVAARNN